MTAHAHTMFLFCCGVLLLLLLLLLPFLQCTSTKAPKATNSQTTQFAMVSESEIKH